MLQPYMESATALSDILPKYIFLLFSFYLSIKMENNNKNSEESMKKSRTGKKMKEKIIIGVSKGEKCKFFFDKENYSKDNRQGRGKPEPKSKRENSIRKGGKDEESNSKG